MSITQPSTTGTVTVDGFRLKYVVQGRGVPALVIGSVLFYPRVFSGELRNYLRLTFIDHRGFVPPPDRPLTTDAYDLEVLLDDIAVVVAELQLKQFLIIGHSGHAFLALEYAKRHPAQVTGVVMIGVSPNYSEATHQATDAFFEASASPERKALYEQLMQQLPELIRLNPEQRFVSYCLCSGPRNWYQSDYDAAPLWEGIYTNMPMIDYVWGEVFRDIDITQGLDTLEVPVWLALGKYDYVTGPPELWERVLPRFHRITMEVFDQSAHYPQWEQSNLFDRKLLAWLEGNTLNHPRQPLS